METLCFNSVKGGVGKTTSAISTAAILAKTARVLLIDADPQNSTTSHFVEDMDAVTGRTIHQVLLGKTDISACVIPIGNLDVVPSELELALIDIELAGRPNQYYMLYEALESVSANYDYCIIDTPPSLGIMTKSAMIASDIVVIPSEMAKFAARSINITLLTVSDCQDAQRYSNKTIRDILILPTLWEDNRVVCSSVYEQLMEKYPDNMTVTRIHRSAEVAKTYSQIRASLPEKGRAFAEYSALIQEVWHG